MVAASLPDLIPPTAATWSCSTKRTYRTISTTPAANNSKSRGKRGLSILNKTQQTKATIVGSAAERTASCSLVDYLYSIDPQSNADHRCVLQVKNTVDCMKAIHRNRLSRKLLTSESEQHVLMLEVVSRSSQCAQILRAYFYRRR